MNAVSELPQLIPPITGIDLPPCPAILLDLQAELGKEEASQREIAYLVSKDVALSGKVMQCVNSAGLGGDREVSSVMQAINMLGSQQLFGMVVGQLLQTALKDGNDLSMERFWDSSALTARVSGEIARRLRQARPDVAYTFGLFHDCGIPLLVKRFDNAIEALSTANRSEHESFTDIEERLLGTNHAIVGYYLARRWKMPDFFSEAVLMHHDYSVFTEPGSISEAARSLVATCVLAEHVIRLHVDDLGEHEWDKAAEHVCDFFHLSLGAVDDLIDDLRDWLG